MNSEFEALYYRLVGYYYNYPTCCIEQFIEYLQQGYTHQLALRGEIARREGFVTGFIPCDTCVENVAHRMRNLNCMKQFQPRSRWKRIEIQILRELAKEKTIGIMA